MYQIKIQIINYALPLSQSWLSSKGSYHTRYGWLVLLTDEAGITGFGDCCPMPEAGTETLAQSENCLRGLLQKPNHRSDQGLEQYCKPYSTSHPAVCCAISTARLDLQARQQQLPLRQLLNKQSCHAFSLNAAAGTLINVNQPRLQLLQRQGFQVIKLKVGVTDPADELAQLHQLANHLDSTTLLRLDANQAWNLRQASYFIDGIQGLPVESLEEPLQTPTLSGLEKLQQRSSIALAADESMLSIGIQALIQSSIRRLVLKPMALGGLQPAMAIAKQAQQAGMDCVVTSVLESAAGICADCQLAAAMEPLFPGLAQGLDTSRWLTQNTGEPPVVNHGRIKLPISAGSGFHPHAQYSRA